MKTAGQQIPLRILDKRQSVQFPLQQLLHIFFIFYFQIFLAKPPNPQVFVV
jgi:hypothetical protein